MGPYPLKMTPVPQEGGILMRTRQPPSTETLRLRSPGIHKQQLKHHPDAIVKLVGRRSPVESSSRSSEGDADGATENSGGGAGRTSLRGDARTLPRIKGKKRHRAGGGHPSTPPPAAHQ